MKFALMQPYFFPYIGYFSLIQSVDHFMFFDDVQYTRKSWMCRNRLLNVEKQQPYYIRPKIRKPIYKALLTDVELDNSEIWKNHLLQQLNGYKKKAKFYEETLQFLSGILERDYIGLAHFNISSTIEISRYLGIKPKFDKYTDYNFYFETKPGIGDWGREVAHEIEVTEYINSPGGEDFIFPDEFNSLGIKLGFIQPHLTKYWQGNSGFIPGLSILDVLIFNGRERTAEMVSDYDIKWLN
jgi:hypothetical protein